jgi:hypothetical protein
MWRELLARHPEAAALPTRNDCSISFELYGGRDPHLIAYDEPLAMAVLFGVESATARLIAPFELALGDVPAAPLVAELVAGEDPVGCAELAFRERVLDAYRVIRAQGLSFPADKAAVMRLLAPRFTKGEMRRVYGALAAAAG